MVSRRALFIVLTIALAACGAQSLPSSNAVVATNAQRTVVTSASLVREANGSCSGELLLNNTFQQGSVDWSGNSWVIFTWPPPEEYNGQPWYAWLGGFEVPSITYLEQTVAIPVGCKATLTYALAIQTSYTGRQAVDRLQLTVGSSLLQRFSNRDGTVLGVAPYVMRKVDLTPFAGLGPVPIQWTAEEQAVGGTATSFFIGTTALTLH